MSPSRSKVGSSSVTSSSPSTPIRASSERTGPFPLMEVLAILPILELGEVALVGDVLMGEVSWEGEVRGGEEGRALRLAVLAKLASPFKLLCVTESGADDPYIPT